MNYFGFAIADSMFSGTCRLSRVELTAEEASEFIRSREVIPAINPSHQATIEAMESRFGIKVAIPEKPPVIHLDTGDSLLVMSVRGLPRLTDRHEYSNEEIAQAEFKFSLWEVNPPLIRGFTKIEETPNGVTTYKIN